MTHVLPASPRQALPSHEPSAPPTRGRASRGLVVAVLAVAATAIVAWDLQVPLVRPVAGLLLLVVLPTYLLLGVGEQSRRKPFEAVLCRFALVLLGLLVAGLAINQSLPLIGVARPLDRVPVLVTADAVLLGLGWCRRRWLAEPVRFGTPLAGLRRLERADGLVIAAASVLVVGAIAGAMRLNNGAGGGVALVVLGVAALVIVALLAWRGRLRPGTIVVSIYLLSLALLLMTSLRGWGIVGHDSQIEFYVYGLTKADGVWRMEAFAQNAYNACLSITILPTVLSVMTGISGVYVFKLLFPMALAMCPVIVYLIARRFAASLVAILAAVYFVSLPTFFTDMPFLGRQAIAFLFVGMIFLIATNARWAVRRRQVWVAALSAGLVLSHYSTTYILIAVLVIALIAGWAVGAAERIHARGRRRSVARRQPRVLGIVNIAVLAALAVVWSGPATHSGGQVEQTAGRVAEALSGEADGQRSADTRYSVLAGQDASPEELLRNYVDFTIEQTADRRDIPFELHPLSAVTQYPIVLAEPDLLPLTVAGRALDAIGVDVPWLNSALRQGAAALVQVFVCVGLLLVLFGRAPRLRVSREMFLLAGAGFVVVASQVLLPAVSADYGVMRAFQQSLFVLAPFLAVGSLQSLGLLGARRAAIGASGIAVAFFMCLTGIVPQALGGYPAQLHLNNAGEYYDLYYPHVEEDAAARWLEGQLLAAGHGVVLTQVPGEFTFGLTPLIGVDRTIFPTMVGPQQYVLLGSTTVGKHEATVWYEGSRLTYEYPMEFLSDRMDVLYHNGEAMIFR